MSKKNSKNVVLIVCDCLRCDCAYDKDIMPFLSSLRNHKDYKYTKNSYTNAPGTYFAMPTMLTGYMPFEKTNQAGIDKHNSDKFLPKLYNEIGYTTIGITANLVTSRAFGFDKFWDTFIDLWKARKKPVKQNMSGEIIIESLKSIKLKKEKNFIYLHFMEPHSPYIPSNLNAKQKREAMELFTKLTKNKTCLTLKDICKMKSLYINECKNLDKHLKATINYLKRKINWDETKVIITADHGEAFYETNYLQHERDHIDNPHHINTPLIVKNIKLSKHTYWTIDIYNLLTPDKLNKRKTYPACIGYKKVYDSVADIKDRIKGTKIVQKYMPYLENDLHRIKLIKSTSGLPYKCRKNYVKAIDIYRNSKIC